MSLMPSSSIKCYVLYSFDIGSSDEELFSARIDVIYSSVVRRLATILGVSLFSFLFLFTAPSVFLLFSNSFSSSALFPSVFSYSSRFISYLFCFCIYPSSDMNNPIKEEKMSGAYRATGEMTNTYKILVGKPEERRKFGRFMCRWEDNIKKILGI